MIFNNKAQVGPKELVLTLVLAGLLFIVGVLIFANVTNVTQSILDPDTLTTGNESVTITTQAVDDTNSTTLAQNGYITDSEAVRNASNGILLNRNIDYRMGTLGSGLTAIGNFTLLNHSLVPVTNVTGFNGTPLFITYDTQEQSSAQASTVTIQTTVLDSFSLGAIALIVLAAVVILTILFRLGQ